MDTKFFACCIMIVVGLVICFGGIYIRKVVSGIMGFIWGITVGVSIAMLLAKDAIMAAAMLGGSDSDSTLYIILVFVIAIAVAYLSVKFDRLFAAIHAFLISFVILLLILLLTFSSKVGVLLVLLALLGAAVVAYFSYLYYMYAFILVTAFSGGLLASLGIDIMVGYYDDMALILLCTVALGCAGTVFQVKQLHRMMSDSNYKLSIMGDRGFKLPALLIHCAKELRISFTIDPERLKLELFRDKLLFIVPIIVFLILPEIDHYWNDSIIAISVISILETVLIGVFLGGFVYSVTANCTLFSLIYSLPYCAGQIFHYHMLFQNDFYGRMVVLFTYVFLWLILKIILVFITDKKAAVIVMTVVVFVWNTWGITLLRDLNGNSLVGINIYNILVAVTTAISVWYLYEARIKDMGSQQPVRKRRNVFAAATIAIGLVTVIGLAFEYIENREIIKFELGIVKESVQTSLPSDEKFEGYSGDLNEFAAFLDGEWDGNKGNRVIFHAGSGELKLIKDGETYTYAYNQLDFYHDGIVDAPWLATTFNRDSNDVLQYHRWVITPSGTKDFFEVFCDYSRKELCWGYYEQTGEGAHQSSAENFYMIEENYDNEEDMNENLKENSFTEEDSVEQLVSEIRSICERTDEELSSMKVEDGGGGTTRYIDSDGKICIIIAEAGVYYDLDSSIQDSKVSYFYDTSNPYEQACFVSVTAEDGEIYKFYLKDSACYRYIDGDGEIYDYPNGVDPMEISKYGNFCCKADLEIAWARE